MCMAGLWPDSGNAVSASHRALGKGGPTDLANLVLLCGRHHWRVHEGGWQLARTASGEVVTVPPVHDYHRPPRAAARGRPLADIS